MKALRPLRSICWLVMLSVLFFLAEACLSPVELEEAAQPGWSELSQTETQTLASLEQVDAFPLYTMTYQGAYPPAESLEDATLPAGDRSGWSCSLFAAFGDREASVFGRNFDWDFSPGLLLFTDPPGGYASVSMVDIAYLGFDGERAFGITDLPLEDRMDLLYAPYLPFDGMNEAGLAVGMAAVPDGGVDPDPGKETIDSLLVMRKILDQAATIEEAMAIFQSYNIDPGGGPPLHYLIAEKSGRSVLVEFAEGEMISIMNHQPWQLATNFLVSLAGENPESHCWRYDLISSELSATAGILGSSQARDLLQSVSQENTQWSTVYFLSTGEIQVVMGRKYSAYHRFELKAGD